MLDILLIAILLFLLFQIPPAFWLAAIAVYIVLHVAYVAFSLVTSDEFRFIFKISGIIAIIAMASALLGPMVVRWL